MAQALRGAVTRSLAVGFVLSACAGVRSPAPVEAPPVPRREAPAPRPAVGMEQRGTASWYGEAHHGKKTASGETFDMHALTAAHRTLPLGAIVKVTNLQNGRAVDVRITDRGPFVHDRVIDLSRAAARAIGGVGEGLMPVRIRVLAVP